MTEVSYFQRFSQKENHITNNTLLMLRHVYQAAPQKLQLVLRALMEDEELDIGLKFEQQVKGSDSVPDALITQPPLAVLVEKPSGAMILQ